MLGLAFALATIALAGAAPAPGSRVTPAQAVAPAGEARPSAPDASLDVQLGPPIVLRDAEAGLAQPARIIPTQVQAAGTRSTFGPVTSFVQEPATGIRRLRLGFAPLSGGAFASDQPLHATTRAEDRAIGRPDALVLDRAGDLLLAYVLDIRGRHDLIIGRLEGALGPDAAYTFAWLDRSDLRRPQQVAFARPADPEAAEHLLGFTAFRTDASTGARVYAARLSPDDLSAEVVDVTPADYRSCSDIRIFHAAMGPVAAARCRTSASAPWQAVAARLEGVQPWTGQARMVDATALGPSEADRVVERLDVDIDPEGGELALIWASTTTPEPSELRWDARRFDLARWSPVGETVPTGGSGDHARVVELDLARQGWRSASAILDLAPDADRLRGRVTLQASLTDDDTPRQGSIWLEPGALPDGILTFGSWRPPSPTETTGEDATPVGLVVYRLDGQLLARRLDVDARGELPTPVLPGPGTPSPGIPPTLAPSKTPEMPWATPTPIDPLPSPTSSGTPHETASPPAPRLLLPLLQRQGG